MIITQEKSVDKPQNIFEVSQILFHQENLKNVIDYLSWYTKEYNVLWVSSIIFTLGNRGR